MSRPGKSLRRRAQAFARLYVQHRPVELDRRFAAMRELVGRADPDLFARNDLTRHEYRVFSQNGEDGVIVEVLNRIGAGGRYFVEFGIESGLEGNCVGLADVFGWSGLFIESDASSFAALSTKYQGSDTVRTVCDLVTPDRVEAIFAAAGVPNEPDVLSIDIDGNDWYVWEAITTYRPRLVVIEYNSGLDLDVALVQPRADDRAWDGTGAYGCSLAALDCLAARKGYRLVHTDLAGVNAFYLRDDLLASAALSAAPRRRANFGLTGGHWPAARPKQGWVTLRDTS